MAAPNEQRIAVPIDDPNADTEWYVTRSLEGDMCLPARQE